MYFLDRYDAGRQLGKRLFHLAAPDVIVLGLPRGGIPVAFEVATALHAPLDLWGVRKLGVPTQPELAMGAIAEGGGQFLHQSVIAHMNIPLAEIQRVFAAEEAELQRRLQRFRRGAPPPTILGKTVLLVDDGLATGSTARAAIRAIRDRHPARLILAVPVAPRETAQSLAACVDELVVLEEPDILWSVGSAYRRFTPTSDEEVLGLLDEAARVYRVAQIQQVAIGSSLGDGETKSTSTVSPSTTKRM